MKSKYGGDFIATGREHYRNYSFNWDNINSFDDFKKAMLLDKSKDELLFSNKDMESKFQSWIDDNPDFDKYFMMVC